MGSIWADLGRKFWCANVMELIERWAYYGVRVVLSIYIVKAASEGGLEFNHIQKGQIYAGWAIVQSTLPILTGGYADRYGHRKIISIAITLKVIGYFLMATQKSFIGFFSGCLLLATGTAIFKPAVQGALASSVSKDNSSVGWGIFYWLVNLGGFLGAWLAGYFRMISWPTVFYANAAIVSLSFFVLLFFPASPPARQRRAKAIAEDTASFWKLPFVTIKDMFEPRLISFLLLYSGWWMMYNQLFDTLPNFMDDWVHSAGALTKIGQFFGNSEWIQKGQNGEGIPNEWILSMNCLTFIILMLPLSWLVRKLHPIYSMVGGMLLTMLGMYLFGSSQSALFCIFGIIVFSVGEMGAGPRMREYLGLISPKGKESRYMGYANLPEAIGWGFGSLIAGYWYETFSDKHALAKQYLSQQLNWTSAQITALPKEHILQTLGSKLHLSDTALTNFLWQADHPAKIWYWFIAIACVSAVGLMVHHQVFPHNLRSEPQDNLK
jgi:proton-dependent oligopeptide transporter, POT family